MVTDLVVLSATAAAVAVVAMALTAIAARRTGRWSVVDVTWGVALTATALAVAVVATLRGCGDDRRWLLLAMVAVWGLRLSAHIARRAHGQGEDPRYEELRWQDRGIVRSVLAPQGVAVWFVALPVQVTAATSGSFVPVVVAGVAVWLVGVVFESVGDAQLAAYKRDPERGPVMDRGLWGWTRHPNYFGDACVWWGVWLVAAAAWPGVLTVLAPVAMTWFLVFATGARPLERSMMQRPGYAEYAARTSMFVPLPPRRG